jgi:hypothetical protein
MEGGSHGRYGSTLGGTNRQSLGGRSRVRAGSRGGAAAARQPLGWGGNIAFGRTSAVSDVPRAEARPKAVRRSKLSEQRFDRHRAANPFASRKAVHKTGFSAAFSAGGLPARIDHSSGVKQRLTWALPFESLNYDPLLLTFFEGLAETDHPFVFVARQGVEDLLAAPGAQEKTAPLIAQIVPLLRKALLVKEAGVFDATLRAIVQLSPVAGPALNPFLPQLLVQISKYTLTGPARTRELVQVVLGALEENGGQDAFAAIKKKVPTWQGTCY